MESIPVAMVRPDLDKLPGYPLPAGYSFRLFRRGEERVWAELQTAVGAFEGVEKALERFGEEFAAYPEDMESRCIFLVDDATSEVIGSTIAWYKADFQGEDHGRIHWVAIRPEYQGRKLAKPMLAAAMRRLAESHARAYLTTQTTAARAINIYLDFGFVPLMTSDRADEAWGMLESELGRRVREGIE